MFEIVIGLLSFLLVINGLYFHNTTLLLVYSLVIIFDHQIENLYVPSIFGTVLSFYYLSSIQKSISTTPMHFTAPVKNHWIMITVILIILLSVDFKSIPVLHLEDFVNARLSFNQKNSIIQRIVKFILPLIILNYLAFKKFTLVIILSILYILLEGSKSSIVSLIGLISFTDRYFYNILSNRIKYLIRTCSIVGFIIAIIIISQNYIVFNYLGDRLGNSEILPYIKLGAFYENQQFFKDFLINPFLIFFSSLLGTESNIHTSAGNWLSNINEVDNFEYLLRLYMEGIVFHGILGIIIIYFIYWLVFKSTLYTFQSLKTNYTKLILPILYAEFIAVLYRGKLTNSITTFVFTTGFLLILFYAKKSYSNYQRVFNK